MMIRIVYCLMVVLTVLPFGDAQASERVPAKIDTSIQGYLQKYGIPGASIAVVENGKIIWAQAYGDADLLTHRPVTVTTRFQAASITKTLTAAAVLLEADKHHIKLDAPVNNYLHRWQLPNNQFTAIQAVTLRMLLNHTASISNPYPDGGYAYNAKLPTLLELFKGVPPATNPPLQVEAVPGKTYKYCNGCYSILQMLLEDVTGKPYPELMQKLILQPLHMQHSVFSHSYFLQHENETALPYDAMQKRYERAPSASPIFATGDLWTTPSDLALYIIAMQQSLNTAHGLLPQPIARSMITPSSTPTRGLGFFIGDKHGDEKADGKYFMHAGANIGYLTLFIGSIDGKHGAVIMINISPPWNATEYPQFGFIKDTLNSIGDYYQWK